MHSRILKGEQINWYLKDVGRPFLAAIVLGGIGRLLMPNFYSPLAISGTVFGIYIVALSGSIISSPIFWARWRFDLAKLRIL
jgi:hypothetical protein